MENIISIEEATKAYKDKVLKALELSKVDVIKTINQKINSSINDNCSSVRFYREDFSSLNILPQFMDDLMIQVEFMLISAGYNVIHGSQYRGADWELGVDF